MHNNVNAFNDTELSTEKMVKMVNFKLCVFHHSKKKKKKDAENCELQEYDAALLIFKCLVPNLAPGKSRQALDEWMDSLINQLSVPLDF